MRKQTALKAIFFMSIIGVIFSGFLSYTELFTGVCSVGGCSYVLGAPACVYGFIMYSIVLILSLIGIRNN